MVCLSKGCIRQILLDQILNTFSYKPLVAIKSLAELFALLMNCYLVSYRKRKQKTKILQHDKVVQLLLPTIRL